MSFPIVIGAIMVSAGLYLLARWVADADPKLLARNLRYAAMILAAIIVIGLYAAGRLAMVILAAAILIPILLHWRSLYAQLKPARPAAGQTSSISTAFLDMLLDHDSGEIGGTVKRGEYEGRDLAGMTLEDLQSLRRECHAQDPQSLAILEAYMDRRFSVDWRGADDGPQAAAANAEGGPMTRDEAYRFLGLDPGASPAEIKAAHHRMMKNFHPDHGGSDYVAAKLNEAKAILLGE